MSSFFGTPFEYNDNWEGVAERKNKIWWCAHFLWICAHFYDILICV